MKVPTANASASASLVKTFKASASRVSYLIQAVQSYVVATNGPVTLTGRALGLLKSKPEEFLVRCGDRYVNSVTYQAKIVALLTYEASSEERALQLAAGIGAGGGVGPAQVDASVKTKLSDASKRSDVKASITVIAQGFDLAPSDTLVGINGSIDEKLKRIDEVGKQLGASLKEDRAKDAANYAGNTTRNAIAANVGLTRYGAADNAPAAVDTSGAFRKNQQQLQKTESFLRAFGQLKLQMEHAYRYEIADFLGAGPEAQASYNLVPPAAPKRFSSELGPIAQAWAARFRDDDGVNVGTDVHAITQVFDECTDSAKNGDFSACHLDVDPTTLREHAAGRAAIDEYMKTARILKLRFYVMQTGAPSSYKSALAECKNHDGWVDRLPTDDEARRLAPVVAGYGGGSDKTIWTADKANCNCRTASRSSRIRSAASSPSAAGRGRCSMPARRASSASRRAAPSETARRSDARRVVSAKKTATPRASFRLV